MLTLSKFQEIYSRFQSSGLRVRDFCHNDGLHESKFYYWQKKLRSTSACPGHDFIPIVFDPPPSSSSANDAPALCSLPSGVSGSIPSCYPCEIVYPGGAILRLSPPADVDLLRQLLFLNP